MILKTLKNKIILFLRGDYNSVRYRFLMMPKEKLYYYWFRLKGKSWIDFYANRLNNFVEQSNFKIVNKDYLKTNKETMQFLKKKGLKKDNSFLDFGCGFFRLGVVLIPYLDNKKYVGIDISKNRIEAGIRILEKADIKKNQYTSIVNDSNTELQKILKKKFDFIYLESVVTHMPKSDFKKLLISFSKILKENGVIYLTFIIGNSYKIFGIKDFIYPFSLIRELSNAVGFDAKIDLDWPDKDFPMVELKFKNK